MNAIREYIDSITRRAAQEANADPSSDARQELASHLFDLATSRAMGRPLTLADIDAAWAELSPKAIYLLREDSSIAATVQTSTGPRAAGWIWRFGAYLADVAAVVVAAAVVIVPLNYAPVLLSGAGEVLFIVGLPVTILAAMTAFEVLRGATPGKLLLRLRTVDANGQSPSWLRAGFITLPKIFPPLLALDVLLGVITGPRDRRRLTERLVKFQVIKVN